MRAGCYQQRRVVAWNWIEVNPQGKHPRKQVDWWRDMVNAAFHAPRSEPCDLDAMLDRDCPVLMPIQRPVSARRFVEHDGTNRSATRADRGNRYAPYRPVFIQYGP